MSQHAQMPQENKISIHIYGSKFNISTAEDPDYVRDLGHEIDKLVQRLVASGNGISVVDALVLASLNYLDGCKKAQESADHLRSQVAEYLEDATKARQEVEQLRKRLARLTAKEKETREKAREPAKGSAKEPPPDKEPTLL